MHKSTLQSLNRVQNWKCRLYLRDHQAYLCSTGTKDGIRVALSVPAKLCRHEQLIGIGQVTSRWHVTTDIPLNIQLHNNKEAPYSEAAVNSMFVRWQIWIPICIIRTLPLPGIHLRHGRIFFTWTCVVSTISTYKGGHYQEYKLSTCALKVSLCWTSSSICFTTAPNAASSFPERKSYIHEYRPVHDGDMHAHRTAPIWHTYAPLGPTLSSSISTYIRIHT